MTTALTSSTAAAAPRTIGQSRDQALEIDAHADGDQEDAEAEPANGAVITSTSRDIRSRRSRSRRSARRGWARSRPPGRQAGDDHDEQADREEQFGALGPRRLREQAAAAANRPRTSMAADHATGRSASVLSKPSASPASAADALEQRRRSAPAPDPRTAASRRRPGRPGCRRPRSGARARSTTRARASPRRQRTCDRIVQPTTQPTAISDAQPDQLGRCRPRTPAGASPQPAELTAPARPRTAAGRCRARRTARSRAGFEIVT